MKLDLDVQVAVDEADAEPPSSDLIQQWVALVLDDQREEAELVIRIVSKDEIQTLNRQYRHKDSPTNVLSFPFESPPGLSLPLLGDIAICAEIVCEEAFEQGKSTQAHWAHMVVHGVLHLLGYDHVDDDDAEEMEEMEIDLLESLGFDDPYIVTIH